jgi:hypothetical protein
MVNLAIFIWLMVSLSHFWFGHGWFNHKIFIHWLAWLYLLYSWLVSPYLFYSWLVLAIFGLAMVDLVIKYDVGVCHNLWSCDVDMACHMATRLTSTCNTSWLVTLISHHDSCHWLDELISFISYLKILLSFVINNNSIFHVIVTWHAIWQQGVTNFHDNPWFFVTW